MVRSSRGTPHSLTGSINRKRRYGARCWRRYGGNQPSLYRNGNCLGQTVRSCRCLNKEQLDYTHASNTPGIQRGYQYCARLALGQDVRTTNLGTYLILNQWMRASGTSTAPD